MRNEFIGFKVTEQENESILCDCHFYSVAETAKANNLKPYEYFKYLLEEIPKHMNDKNQSFMDALLSWSKSLPEKCKNSKLQ